jgi:hypothetical protein
MITALVLAAFVQTGGAEVVAQFSSYFRAERWDFAITYSTLERTPAWDESASAPSLSPRQALEIAGRQLTELVADSERWRVKSISLRPVGSKNYWVYLIEFGEPPPRSDGGITSSLGLVVLMDGNAIVPIRSRWPPQ